VAAEQMQKLKQMMEQTSRQTTAPQGLPQTMPNSNNIQGAKLKTNLAGIISFSLLSVLAGAAAASWYFLKTFKPFFAGLISLLLLSGSFLANKQPFFKLQEPNDFLKAIKNR
jgi:hypothetical protein